MHRVQAQVALFAYLSRPAGEIYVRVIRAYRSFILLLQLILPLLLPIPPEVWPRRYTHQPGTQQSLALLLYAVYTWQIEYARWIISKEAKEVWKERRKRRERRKERKKSFIGKNDDYDGSI